MAALRARITRDSDDHSATSQAIGIGVTADVYDDTPTASISRQLESPTAASLEGGVRERIEVVRGVGLTLAPIYADPLTI